MKLLATIIQDAALVVIGFTLLYVFSLTIVGVRIMRRSGIGLRRQESLINEPPRASDADYHVYFLLPCLNEEEVIGGTIDALLESQQRGAIVVIDDGSEDATAAIARSKGDQVVVVSRTLPNARQGKGRALNAGLELVRRDVESKGLPTRKVLVCVMDADGRMTPNALDAVAPAFDEPSVGGVQLVVRIRNRDSLKLRFQDMEFWAMSGVGQIGRMATGTVSMGGNGQFTRLFALDEIGTNPWSDSLTEDLDLGISLSVLGWTTTSTSGAYVTQQGVDDLRRLIKQRTRWYQGHMLASKRFGELLRSPFLRNIGFFELGAYLAVPWGITLPWSIIQQYLLVQILTGQGLPNHVLESGPIAGRVGYAVVWYLASFAPHLFWGWLYWRRAEDVNMGRALLMCHLMVPWSYVSYAAAWRAFYRIVTGQHGWTKTARSAEDAPEPLGNTPPDGTATANHIGR
ncbi:MAG: hypothetical protein QOH56_3793 [Pseudonocardiales bacterium]|nr:hypothetical protein [Pseudonocardiales bacterium]